MKLLVIGHSYIKPIAQAKYVAMKRQDRSMVLRIVTPSSFSDAFATYRHKRHEGLEEGETVAIPKLFGRSHMTYLLDPVRLRRLIATFRPHHVHIEEDPHSAVGLETVSLVRAACRRATISFFIWDNLARVPPFPLSLAKRAFARYALDNAELVVCGNRDAERLLKTAKAYRGLSTVLPQVGLDPADYEDPPCPEVRARLRPDGLWIGYVGRLIPEKGLRGLLEALSGLSDLPWRVAFIGNGPFGAEIEAVWQPKLGNRLLHLDVVPHERVAEYLKCLDLFVNVTYTTEMVKEQFGLTLAQAMMAGVACIGSTCGAIPDVLDDAGLVVPERNVAALRDALKRLLLQPDLRRDLGARARARARQHFTNDVVSRGYLAAFRQVMGAGQVH